MRNMNKKGIATIAIMVLALAIVGAAFIIVNPFAKGEPSPAPDTKQSIPVGGVSPCPAGQERNAQGICVVSLCPTGQVRAASGECVLSDFGADQSAAACKPSGFFKSAYVRTKANVGDLVTHSLGSYPAVVTYQFQVTSACEANYYFEAGVAQLASPLTILAQQGSKCDGDNHYAGKWIKMSRDTITEVGKPAGLVDIAFFPFDYGKAESLKVVGGVYTGCMKDGGVVVAQIPETKVSYKAATSGYSDQEITSSWVKTV